MAVNLTTHGVDPPSGWVIENHHYLIVPRGSPDYAALLAWANEQNFKLVQYTYRNVRVTSWAEVRMWTTFFCEADHTGEAETDNAFLLGETNCPFCNYSLPIGTVFCGGCLAIPVCMDCRSGGLKFYKATSGSRAWCAACVRKCETPNCAEVVSPDLQGDLCLSCNPRFLCVYCGVQHPESVKNIVVALPSGPSDVKEIGLCPECTTRHVCTDCGKADPRNLINRKCAPCRDREIIEREKEYQAWPAEDMPSHGGLVIPASASRPVRTMSIEIEFDGEGSPVARSLYRYGLLEQPGVGRYSSRGDSGGRAPAILKSDSSVTGGELVVYMLDLDKENHAAALQRVTEVMRSMRELSLAHFGSDAGGHVHVDMHGYGLQDCWNLATLFKFLEDPLYRLGGAGELGYHRSQDGNTYAQPPRWGPFGSLQQFALKGFRADRAGIHFRNYYDATNACRCGSVTIGKHDDCKCDLGKATVEWRLWNAEITPVILHAWLALTQSMTAFAQDTELPEDEYPYLSYQNMQFKRTGKEHKSATKERLEWMFKNLPLTNHERASIVTTAKRCELSELGVEYLNSLAEITSVNDQTVQKKRPPRNPSNSRDTTFTLPTADELLEVPATLASNYDGVFDDYDPDYLDDPY